MWPGFSSFIADDLSSKDKLSYLNMIRQNSHLELQEDKDRKLVSDTISSWISSPLTRYEGLVLWHLALEKYQLYINNWGRLLKASLELSTSSTRKIALKILSKMVLIFGNSDVYKLAFDKFMPDMLPRLLIDLEDNEGFVLSCECLAVFMKCLPDLLSTHSVEIETFLVKNLDNDSVQVVEALADCFAILPKCSMRYLRPKSTYPEAWADLYDKTVNTLQSLIKDILMSHTGVIRPKTEEDKKPMFKIPCEKEGGLSYLCHKVRVFSSLGRCLAKLMCSDTYRVRVYLDDMFLLIRRVISFPEETASQPIDASLIHLTYPKLCQVAFMLMEAIVLNFCVVEFNSDILALALKATRNAQIASQTPLFHSEVRLSTYKFLNVWIKHSGCTVSSKIVSDNIVGELLSDIVILGQEDADSVLIKQTCTEALKVLSVLIQSACSFFENQNIEFVISSILQVVGQIQNFLNPLTLFPLPYSDDNCRLELCNLLLTCCVSEHPFQKNCILRSVFRFNSALVKDSNIEVTSMCQKALNLLRYFLNPKKPPPDYTLLVRAVDKPRIPVKEWVDNDTNEADYQRYLKEQAASKNNLPNPPPYQADSVFQEAVVDNENNIERQSEPNSSPTFIELGPPNHYNNNNGFRTRQSSQSDDHESEPYENTVLVKDKERSLDGPHSRVSKKQKRSYIPKANRPNIQILEAHNTAEGVNDARTDEDSSDANVTVFRDTQSDQNSEEEDVTPMQSPKTIVSENGALDESDEEEDEEGFDDDENDEEDDDDDGEAASEERQSFSPEPEERAVKRLKMKVDDPSSEEEYNRHSAECEEMGSNEGYTDEQEVNPEVNGEEDVGASVLERASPTVEEMVLDFVLAEAVES